MKRILFIQTAFLGDVILATAAIAEAKRIFPQAEIDVVVKKGNESLLLNNPAITNTIVFDKSGGKIKEILRLRKFFRIRNYDIAFNFHRFGMQTEDGIDNYQYGLHIWTYQGHTSPVVYCRGILGQYIITIPEENLVIVRLGQKKSKNYTIDGTNASIKQLKKVGHSSDFLKYITFAEQIVKESKKQ